MTARTVIFQPEAISQLENLQDCIAHNASPAIAGRYAGAIFDHCESLVDFPYRGTARDDVGAGLRTISYRGRALIVFTIGEESIDILGIFYGGQNWEPGFTD